MDNDEKKAGARDEERKGERSRIAQAGRKILDQARRSLPLFEHSQKKAGGRGPGRDEEAVLAAFRVTPEQAGLVEVVDEFDRPLACLTPQAALRQKLGIRLVLVGLRTGGGGMLLRRRADERLPFVGRWDFFSGFVHVRESREDAALRLLEEAGGIGGLSLLFTASGRSGGEGRIHLSLFTAELPAGLYPSQTARAQQANSGGQSRKAAPQKGAFQAKAAQSTNARADASRSGARNIPDFMEVDADELAGLVHRSPELLTPELIWASAAPALFR